MPTLRCRPSPVRQLAIAPGSRASDNHTRPSARPANWVGDPSNAIRPASITTTRSHSASTSSVMWVDSTTQRCSACCDTSPRNRRRCSGSSPTVGSSSTSSRGSPNSDCASATLRRIPPDSLRIFFELASARSTASITRLTSSRRARRSVCSLRTAM